MINFQRKNTILPTRFPIESLHKFEFGNFDGNIDQLLFETFCKTSFTNQCVLNKKTIILGHRGTGKSAIYSLIKNKKLPLNNNKNSKIRFIGISDELRYVDIDRIMENDFGIYNYPEDYKYSLLWDLYILFKILLVLDKELWIKARKELKRLKQFFQHIDINKDSSFSIFIDKIKAFRMKLSASDGSYIYTLETSINKANAQTYEIPIYSIKQQINEILKFRKIKIVILIDKIDDFVMPSKENIQKKIVQGLLYSEDSFQNYENILLKIFLRSDLFYQANTTFIGLGKLRSRITECNWNNSDILKFIARRISDNLFKILFLKKMQITGKNYITPKDTSDLNRIKIRELSKYVHDHDEGNVDNFSDNVYLKLILKIFPDKINHINEKGIIATTTFQNFINTHLKLDAKNHNPRIVLRFLELCIEETTKYYELNSMDIENVKLNKNLHYPLIKRKSILKAYKRLSEETWSERISDDNEKWKSELQKLQAKKGRKEKYYFKEIQSISGLEREECEKFIDYCIFTNVLEKFGKGQYRLPILLKAYNY